MNNVLEIQELMEQVRKRSGNYCTFTIKTKTDGDHGNSFATYIAASSDDPKYMPCHLAHKSMEEAEGRFRNYMVDCKTEVRAMLENDKARWEGLVAEINDQLKALEES